MDVEGKRFLKEACPEARKWARQYATLSEAWQACERPTWMLWALDQLKADPIRVRRFACWCVRETPLPDGRKVWDLLTDERSRHAVEVAEALCDGKVTQKELAAAGAAAWAVTRAAAGDATGAAAWAATRAAAGAAAWAATRAAAGAAGEAAGDAAGEAAAWAAAGVAQAKALRTFFPDPFSKLKGRPK